MPSAKQRVIDFRLRPPVNEFLEKHPLEKTLQKLKATGSKPTPSILHESMDLLLQEMDEVGIQWGVVNGSHWQPPSVGDEQVAKILKMYPDRLVALAAPDFRKPMKEVLHDLEFSIRKLGFRGVALESYHSFPPMHVDDPHLFPIYEKCIELDVFVQLLSGSINSCPDLTYTAPVHYQHVVEKYPELKIVIAHACYPYITEVIALIPNSIRKGKPNIFLEPDMFLFMPGGGVYIEAMNAFPDSFLYASTYPYGTFAESIEKVNKLPIGREARSKFLYENAAQLLKL